ncbi:hypothetical protein AGMMS49957_02460 [Synergistales bacterium]|nr:hypothetical protein AGMMS49957_02460 [Synergistales bacterium]
MNGCPGAAGIKGAPTLKIKTCPECGGEIEIFSVDTQVACPACGFIAYNDALSCVSWCKYARECVGDAMYERFVSRGVRK